MIISWNAVLWGSLVFAGSILITATLAIVVILRLPADYFTMPRRAPPTPRHPALHVLRLVAKNLAGLLLILAGVVMSVPGIPGQGILTLLIGILLVDFPGKYRIERWLIRRPRIARPINWLRRRFRKPPMEIPG
ncbi:MAG: hypothetical protein HYY16_16665 [Planctomycetes bacterium]|nr:hypothetical protein [Planctomycetota bacterium]